MKFLDLRVGRKIVQARIDNDSHDIGNYKTWLLLTELSYIDEVLHIEDEIDTLIRGHHRHSFYQI
jgi:hypothetical protein